MEYDKRFMARCIQLARLGGGYVAPNPMVGAVVVCDGRIVGEGYHHRYGEAHAEPNAIHSVLKPELLEQSTLYVSLEPCSHYGKTPPCANLIVQSKIPRVVIGTLDPNPKVSGRGVEILRKAGIEVEVGVMQSECRDLNKRFFIYQEQHRPFVLLKWAQTTDGFIDTFRKDTSVAPLAISNHLTRQLTHKMRSENQSILVGCNTVMLDNPSLTVRNWPGKNPLRLAIDSQGRIPGSFHLLDGTTPTCIFTTHNSLSEKPNVEYIVCDLGDAAPTVILAELYKRNIHSVLVEGGARLLSSFIHAGLWDEANVEIAPFVAGQGVKAPHLPGQPFSMTVYDGHQWISYKRCDSF